MSIKSKILATAASLTLLGGITAAGVLAAAPAGAATPSCGGSCIDIFSQEYSGTTLGNPQFVLDVFRRHAAVGQPIILFKSSDIDPAEDFQLVNQGLASDFYAAGLMSSAIALRYGCVPGTGTAEFPTCASSVNDPAYEIEFAPFGVDSGLCVGLGATAVPGEGVSLQECGSTSKVVWVQDTSAIDAPVAPYFAAINGSDTFFSNPYVLTYPSNAYPTDKPRAQLQVGNLTGFTGPVTNDTQLWTGVAGVLP